jgi:hypothetical protein
LVVLPVLLLVVIESLHPASGGAVPQENVYAMASKSLIVHDERGVFHGQIAGTISVAERMDDFEIMDQQEHDDGTDSSRSNHGTNNHSTSFVKMTA